MEFNAKTTTTMSSPPFSYSPSSSPSSPITSSFPSPNSHHLSNLSSPHAANNDISTNPLPTSLSPPPPPPPPPPVVLSPCAACKILRRRCAEKCVLAPYFPPNEPLKFTIAHRIFGASNIIKLLQELPESHRADAVSSMVYEANARIRNPIYGCAGAIFQLQKQIGELQAQLAKAQAELANLQCQQGNMIALICMDMTQSKEEAISQQQQSNYIDTSCFLDENNSGTAWDPLWT
ncbi:LOB domain-containing protein 1-like [Malus sylvestris]|uniref:LOB domain-containing protein 1-like n=1 Tax=Malus sylvestris TaxID=3752 RepID=UPI0021AC51C8|nr:LOB domain-containing protein 1-like [Malus sylvestris]